MNCVSDLFKSPLREFRRQKLDKQKVLQLARSEPEVDITANYLQISMELQVLLMV